MCVDVIDLGERQTPWGKKPQVEIRWQLAAVDATTGKRHFVRKTFTASLSPKATLRAALARWTNHKPNDPVLDDLDLEKLLGVNGVLTVAHVQSEDGGTYARVEDIEPLRKGTPKLAPEGYVRESERTVSGDDDSETVDLASADLETVSL